MASSSDAEEEVVQKPPHNVSADYLFQCLFTDCCSVFSPLCEQRHDSALMNFHHSGFDVVACCGSSDSKDVFKV